MKFLKFYLKETVTLNATTVMRGLFRNYHLLCIISGLNSFPAMLNNHLIGNDTSTIFPQWMGRMVSNVDECSRLKMIIMQCNSSVNIKTVPCMFVPQA